MEAVAQEAEKIALQQILKEQVVQIICLSSPIDSLANIQEEARKSKLPDFWLPSLTPEAKASVLDYKDIKLQTLCHAVAPSHPLSYVF